MNDAFGGAFLIRVFLIFVIIYIVLTAVAINYAKAFKAKNLIIEYLESNETVTVGNDMTVIDNNALTDFFQLELLGNLSYKASNIDCANYDIDTNHGDYCNPDYGVVIKKLGGHGNTEGIYYKVSTFFGWDLPVANIFSSNGIWQISGETRLIVNDK